jgi:glycosyltransferase involved in cell wall biosynthesis
MTNYNHGQYIRKALEAILAQSLRPIEVIVVDDGSTDNSVEVIESIMRQDSIVKLLRNDCNRGVSLVSDRESSVSPIYPDVIVKGSENGLSMAMASNGYLVTRDNLEQILPHMTYFRFNISGGEPKRYAEIHGVPESYFYRVCQNI